MDHQCCAGSGSRARYVPAALAGFAVGVTGQPGYLLLGKVAEGACDLVLTGIAAVQVDQRSPGGGVPHAIHQLAQGDPGCCSKHVAGMAEVVKMQVGQTEMAGALTHTRLRNRPCRSGLPVGLVKISASSPGLVTLSRYQLRTGMIRSGRTTIRLPALSRQPGSSEARR
jgi:hypothetical protein